ncbi:CPBP family intramembrane metalloprotease [Flavobacteriaceae bacterium]|nr:CPBP family intramembrane metalloprotease [Flavobacteriaceae bacterium]|tara:strand:+ start:12894 stop:13841 length:948 start_codon:yes stop_codon:yes gene_type:complete
MYIEQAFKFKQDLWRYLLGILIVFILGWQIIGVIPLGIVSWFKASNLEEFITASESAFSTLFPLKSNLYLFLMLLTFIGGFVALFVVIKFLHHQSFIQLTTSRDKIDWSRFFFGFGIIAFLTITTTAFDFYSNPENYLIQFEWKSFSIMFLIAIVLIPLQTSFEEYFFRGYLMQGIGIAVKNKWIPLLMTSIIFGSLHFFNPEVDKIGNIAMVYYIGTGFFLGIITLMDEGMELSLGFHAGTNLIIVLLVTSDWTVFQTNSILLDLSDPSKGIEVVLPVFILYPILLGVMAWKYKWTNWKEKLFGKVLPLKKDSI